MERKVKKQLIIVAIVFLIVINISALSTLFYHTNIKPRKIERKEYQQEQMQIKGMRNFFRNELNLSEEQFEEFRKVNQQMMMKSRLIANELNDNRIYMLEELAKENPNLKKLDSIAYNIGDLHYELKNNTINHFLELKSLCTEEQQVILQDIFSRIIQEQDQGPQRPDRFRDENRNHRERRGRNRNRP